MKVRSSHQLEIGKTCQKHTLRRNHLQVWLKDAMNNMQPPKSMVWKSCKGRQPAGGRSKSSKKSSTECLKREKAALLTSQIQFNNEPRRKIFLSSTLISHSYLPPLYFWKQFDSPTLDIRSRLIYANSSTVVRKKWFNEQLIALSSSKSAVSRQNQSCYHWGILSVFEISRNPVVSSKALEFNTRNFRQSLRWSDPCPTPKDARC